MKGRRIAYWLFIRIPFWGLVISFAFVTLLKWVPVRYTPLMLKRAFQFRSEENYHSEQKWVSLEDIAPELIQAVIAAEDQRFWEHRGFDWTELQGMWRSHRQEGMPLRGCSTISQQTAKNVFTFATPTWGRKAVEAWWTFLIEAIWGKNRILEVYLNVAETGKGLYGVEAAAQYYFGIPSTELNLRQSVSIAVCLPSPMAAHPDYLPVDARTRFAQILGLSEAL
jgi:monofunctional biosynthetic peptidoglycan transglycosylase